MAYDGGGDSGFFKGFLFGGLIGAVAALLLAPKTGREMREDISRRSRELKDDVELELEQAVKRAEEILAENQQRLENFKNETKASLSVCSYGTKQFMVRSYLHLKMKFCMRTI